jgi:hypothetical protein
MNYIVSNYDEDIDDIELFVDIVEVEYSTLGEINNNEPQGCVFFFLIAQNQCTFG